MVPEEVGAGDLPLVALSDDVVDENESPLYRSPRTQMSSELPTKRSMYGLLNPEMEALHKQIAERGVASLSQIPENQRVPQDVSQSSVGPSMALVSLLPRPESPRDPFGTPSPEWGRVPPTLDVPGGIPPLASPAYALPLPAFAPMAFPAVAPQDHGGDPPSFSSQIMEGGSIPASHISGGVFNQDPPDAPSHDPLPPEDVDEDWEGYWLPRIHDIVDVLKDDCHAEFQHVGDVMNILDQRINGQQVVLEDLQKKFQDECLNVDAQFVSKENRFQQLTDECKRKFNGHDLQIATLSQNVDGLTHFAKTQGAVVSTGASDQSTPLLLQTCDEVTKLGTKVEGLEKKFEGLDSDFGRLHHKVHGLEDNYQRNLLANKELPAKVVSIEQQVKLGFHLLTERNKVFADDQQQMVASLDQLGHQQRQFHMDFDHFSRQIGLNEAHFEQRHHEHDEGFHHIQLEIQGLRNDNARLHQVVDALLNSFSMLNSANPPPRPSSMSVVTTSTPFPMVGGPPQLSIRGGMSPVTLGHFSANLGVFTHLPVSTSPQGLGGGGPVWPHYTL